MTALQVYNQLAGSSRGGGWPLSMFLTPEAEPFVGGTYFPARDGDREGASGFLQLAQKIQEIWSKEPARIRDDAKAVAKFTKEQMERRAVPNVTIDGIATERHAGSSHRDLRSQIRRLWLYARWPAAQIPAVEQSGVPP